MVFRVWLGNTKLVGETVKDTATPLPDSGTVWVDVPTRIENVAVFGPVVVGLKVAVTVQLAPAARDVPHVRVSVNWFAFVPESVGAVSASAAVLLLRMETANAVLLFTSRSPNASATGESVNGEGAVTVYDTVRVALLPAKSVACTVKEFVPTVLVEKALPEGTVPMQATTLERASAQL